MSSKPKTQLLYFVLSFCLLGLHMPQAYAQNEFSTVMDNIRAGFANGSVSSHNSAVATWLSSQNADGSWPDIDYQDHSQTLWKPGDHWARISIFCRAYSRIDGGYYGSVTLRQAILKAMNYWLSISPEPYSTNWFMGTISLPRDIGTALVAMRYGSEPLSSGLQDSLINIMTRGIPITKSPAKDGSNLTDVAQNYIMRACLKQNQDTLSLAVTAVTNAVVIASNGAGGTSGAGIQADNSFTAHGPQLYIYGYGSEFVSGISNIAGYVKGTSFAFSAEKMAVFSTFVRGGIMKVNRGMYADYNVFNRSITRPDVGKASGSIVTKAKNVDLSQYAAEYDLAISRMTGAQAPSYQVAPEHLHYWRSDYTVHHRAKYMFGLRSVSTRTAKAENGNGENLKGYYLTEGTNYIAVNGDEYYNIYPVWEWNKIPGTTVPEITNYPLPPEWGVPGTSGFVGGVSDLQYGVSTYVMNDYNTQAKKSWFFFDDEVVCLGAGISSTAAEAINTTVNQCLLDGNVTIKTTAGTQTLSTGSHQYNGDLQWAHHDNVGYFFPQGGAISVSNQAQSGTQYDINHSYSSALITKNVFKLWFRHGISPSGSSYAYIVAPGKTLAEMDAYNATQLQVWSNTSTVQAVYHSGLDMLQVVFYQAGTITNNGITASVNSPCALVLKNISTSSVTVSVADPTQLRSSVAVSVQNAALEVLRTFTANLPNGVMAGSTISGTINTNTPVVVVADVVEAAGDASDAVQAHLDHGDKLGSCGITASNAAAWNLTNEATVAYNVSVYPNPVQDNLYIKVDKQGSDAMIQVYNALGDRVRSVRLITGKQEVSLKGLAAGIYFVNIQNGGQIVRKKIVKQ